MLTVGRGDKFDEGIAVEALVLMRVQFIKMDGGRLCGWVAAPPKRRPFLGTTMAAGRDVPHDLSQFVIERALDIRDGFWGLLAHDGWFASVPGRRPTEPGRAIVRRHRDALMKVEGVVNSNYAAWQRRQPTPVSQALDAMLSAWRILPDDGQIVLEWPVRPLPGEPQKRNAHYPNRSSGTQHRALLGR